MRYAGVWTAGMALVAAVALSMAGCAKTGAPGGTQVPTGETTVTAFVPDAPREVAPRHTIARTPRAVTVDGDLSEWAGVPAVVIDKQEQVHERSGKWSVPAVGIDILDRLAADPRVRVPFDRAREGKDPTVANLVAGKRAIGVQDPRTLEFPAVIVIEPDRIHLPVLQVQVVHSQAQVEILDVLKLHRCAGTEQDESQTMRVCRR